MTNSLVEIGKSFDRVITPVLMSQSVGRILIPKNMELSGKGIGNTSVMSFGYKGTADAITDYDIRNDIEDTIDVSDSKILIPIQQDKLTIPRRTFESMVNAGMTPDADYAIGMAVKVSAQLDKTIIQGWDPEGDGTYAVKGFYQIAGLSGSGNDFGTYGGAVKTVSGALAAFRTAKIFSQGYNLVVHPTNYEELMISESTNGVEEFPRVQKLLNRGAPGNPGDVVVSEDLTAGTCFVAPVASKANQMYFDLIEAQQPTNDLRYEGGDEKYGNIVLRQIGAAVPRFKHINKSTGLSPTVYKATAI